MFKEEAQHFPRRVWPTSKRKIRTNSKPVWPVLAQSGSCVYADERAFPTRSRNYSVCSTTEGILATDISDLATWFKS
jgi:hypothetical protein